MTGNFTPFPFREPKNRPLILALLGLSAALFTYTLIRAWTVVYTPDEVYSLWEFARKFTFYPETYNDMSANHHWLNSWAMWGMRQLFGENEFASRVPTVLSHLVYLFFTARIALTLSRQFVFVIAAFLLLNAHPYLLDFFSIARGYGMSLAALSASIFFALRFASDIRRTRDMVYCLVAGILAVLASFVLVNYYVAVCGLMLLMIWPGKRTDAESTILRLEQTLLLGVISLGMMAFVMPHLFYMQQAKSLYFGAPGFWDGTVGSMCVRLLYDAPYQGGSPFGSSKLTLQVLIAAGLVSTAWLIRKNGFRAWLRSPAGFSVLLLAVVITVLAAQRLLLGTLYPQYRTGLFVFVIFLLVILTNIAEFPFRSLRVSPIVAAVLAAPVLFHFFCAANFVYVEEWKPSGGLDRFAQRIIDDHKNFPGEQIRLSGDGTSTTTMKYLREKQQFLWLEVESEWNGQKEFKPADYYLVEKSTRRVRNTQGWVAIDSCPKTGNVLYADPGSPAARFCKSE